jgi:hypothetical protein
VHDASRFEIAGLPAVVIATDPFLPTVDATVDVIGMTGMRIVYVPHPVSRLDDDGFRALAARIAGEIGDLLVDA